MSSPDRPAWLDDLARWPDQPWWIAAAGPITRAAALDDILATSRRLRAAGWQAGHRLAVVPDSTPAFARLVLGALAGEVEVLLLPLRESDARRRALAARAGAAGLVLEPATWMSSPIVPAQLASGPARLWLRSSGSLGQPRWVLHDPDRLLAGARLAAAAVDFAPGARWACSLPFDHAGGVSLIWRALAGGGALQSGEPLAEATHLSLVPTQLARHVGHDDGASLRHLATVLLGGAPLPPLLRRRAARAGIALVISYGLSETCGMIAAGRDRAREPNWAGRPLPGWRLRVGDAGELSVAGPGLCVATADDDGGVASSPRGTDAWLITGDLARREPDDSLFILGRRDNVIITGGEKLPAEELEAAIADLEGVEAVVVVPVPDDEWGQRPAAFVRFAEGQERALAGLAAELTGLVASWKLPVAILPLPASSALKPDRAALARLAASHRG